MNASRPDLDLLIIIRRASIEGHGGVPWRICARETTPASTSLIIRPNGPANRSQFRTYPVPKDELALVSFIMASQRPSSDQREHFSACRLTGVDPRRAPLQKAERAQTAQPGSDGAWCV